MERVDGLHMRPLQSCVPSSVEQLLRAQLTTSRTLTVSIAVVIIWPTRGARISVLHDDNNDCAPRFMQSKFIAVYFPSAITLCTK